VGTAVDPHRIEATRLGSYEILRKIARGGMAELYLARTKGPEGFEKLVVLKKILPSFAENPKFVRLFLDEAKLAAGLDHPHIAHVYDMGTVDGNYFFTMEYVHGQDVRSTLRRTSRMGQQFPLDHALQIARNVAAALHYAHERRRPDGSLLEIVHRDVSPSNIIISYDGGVKLVDFGVAKAATSSVKTRTGTLKGKISYMSPEQAKGAPIDRRSDIFSLGIVLWEMVTTQRLFKADNDLATIQMIINSKAQPPSQLRQECTPELERIVMKALSPDLATRYQTAEEMQLELEELAREQKLKQSSVGLRSHMHLLFDAEIKAWKDAQASGITLTDHVIGATTSDMTTPVSESELEYLGDALDDEDEEEEPSTVDPPTIQIDPLTDKAGAMEVATTQTPAHALAAVQAQPSVMVGRVDHTPAAPIRTPTVQPIAHSPSGAIRMPSATGGPFPVAPKEWMPPPPAPIVGEDLSSRQKKRLVIGGAITFGLIVIVALAFGGSGTSASDDSAAKVDPAPAPTADPAPAPAPASTPAPPAKDPDPPTVAPPAPANPPAPQVAPPAPANPAPPQVAPACDAEALDEKARQDESVGNHTGALAAMEQAIKCAPNEHRYQLAFLSACNASDGAKAKLYYQKIPASTRTALRQICVRNGINLDPPPAPHPAKAPPPAPDKDAKPKDKDPKAKKPIDLDAPTPP
jgi:serine/threonine protein kinase